MMDGYYQIMLEPNSPFFATYLLNNRKENIYIYNGVINMPCPKCGGDNFVRKEISNKKNCDGDPLITTIENICYECRNVWETATPVPYQKKDDKPYL